jgi:aminoglycoside phosphotransferase (APT) family kinase protein
MSVEMNNEWDMEPSYQVSLPKRAARRKLPAYSARKTEDVVTALKIFFAERKPGASVGKVNRMGGGASKEQFLFTLQEAGAAASSYVLRMDPLEAITETSRKREFEILNAVQGVVPAPQGVWLDEDGRYFGQPAAIMNYVAGVTKPSNAGLKVSGLGTSLGETLRAKLRGPFLDYLVKLHAMDWRKAHLPSFAAPLADPKQAARWSLNYWKQMWRMDSFEAIPIVSYAEQWLTDNLPDCAGLVLTHGDYRTGNYLFEESTGKITAILDWELARIGDYHEDLAWVLMQVFGTFEDGQFRASDLYSREDFIKAYEAATGRTVSRRTLHYYDVMSSWKCYIITAANGMSAARAQHNHQDVLLTFLAATDALFASDLCRLLKQGAEA